MPRSSMFARAVALPLLTGSLLVALPAEAPPARAASAGAVPAGAVPTGAVPTGAVLTGAVPAGAAGAAGAEAASRYVTDDRGRALILHGLNTASSAKGPSGLPWISRADVVRERRLLGTDSVRYLLQWKNVEPRPGRYDDRYLDAVAERITWYREQGMHVVLDMHQDIFGPAACKGVGNGAPAWATYTDGLPCTPQEPWVLTYLQPAVLRAYDHLWNNSGEHPELARRYAAMWRHVARRFAREPAVLGYDLMNEPFGGTRQFGFFEGPVLTPFYQRVVNAIRTVDRDNWIFVEPQSLGINQGTATSLGRIADPRPGPARIALAPHFYPGLVDLGGTYTGVTKAVIQAEFAAWKGNMRAAADRLGMPLWIGEVGAMNPKAAGALDYTRDWLAMADDLRIGWAYWSNDPGRSDPTGTTEPTSPIDTDGRLTSVGELLVRPYPRAVAGTPTEISYRAGTLTVAWRNRSGVSGPTELWLPEAAFPGSPRVSSTDPAGRWRTRWDAAGRVLRVWADPNTPTHRVTVSAATG